MSCRRKRLAGDGELKFVDWDVAISQVRKSQPRSGESQHRGRTPLGRERRRARRTAKVPGSRICRPRAWLARTRRFQGSAHLDMKFGAPAAFSARSLHSRTGNPGQLFRRFAPVVSPGESAMDPKENQWAMALHLSDFCHFVVVPFDGLIAPIVPWQLKKGEYTGTDAHGKIVVNWLISTLIYGVDSAIPDRLGWHSSSSRAGSSESSSRSSAG